MTGLSPTFDQIKDSASGFGWLTHAGVIPGISRMYVTQYSIEKGIVGYNQALRLASAGACFGSSRFVDQLDYS